MKFLAPSAFHRKSGRWGTRALVVNENSRVKLLHTFICKSLLSSLLLSPFTLPAQPTAQAALSSALRTTPAAGVVVDITGGRQIAAVGATTRTSTPGSILKPLFLSAALQGREVLPQTTVFCRRDLHIRAGSREWDLACTHPQRDVPFSAREALAYSCNRYFAGLADRIAPAQVAVILDHYGLTSGSLPQSQEQKELLVLGVAGIAVSPVQMAGAYRKLALELKGTQALDAVRDGLMGSVDYGMAHNAAVRGRTILGKTGTATDPETGWSHGWFAGIGFLGHQEVAVVIYLPRGNGADAARLAQHVFLGAAGMP
jgi:cell division protein FtsI/penicillin-binding protein 2